MHNQKEIWFVICSVLLILAMTFRKNNWHISILWGIVIGLMIIAILISIIYVIYLNRTPMINKCPKCNVEYRNDIFCCADCKVELKQIKIKKS